MTGNFAVLLLQTFSPSEIVLVVFPILVGTGLVYFYVRSRRSGAKISSRRCPHCKAAIDSDTNLCPSCGRFVA